MIAPRLTLLAIITSLVAADDPPQPGQAAQIRAVLDAQIGCWNKGDLDGFMATYWNSPKLSFQSGGTRTLGWEPTRARYHKRYKAEGKDMGTLTFSEVEIEPLAPEIAIVRGRWKLTMRDGSAPEGLYTLIVKHMPEGWRITHDHTSVAETSKPSP
jgi:beta-aspartyl-peptidase (threonine type)